MNIEILIKVINLILLSLTALMPIALVVFINRFKKYSLLIYIFIGLTLYAFCFLLIAWWSQYSDFKLLQHYGYEFSPDIEHHIAPENLEKVQHIETKFFGTGWPVKALMGFVVYMPLLVLVLLLVYAVNLLILKFIRKRKMGLDSLKEV